MIGPWAELTAKASFARRSGPGESGPDLPQIAQLALVTSRRLRSKSPLACGSTC
jgi:hypothetical protein